jgi:hypothetical protein
MNEYLKRLSDLCDEHEIDMPDNVLDLKAHKFGVDKHEVQELLQEIYDLYYAACDLEE